MPGDDVHQRLVKIGANEVIIAGIAQQFVDGVEHPESGVHRVVFGLLACVGEAIGQHPRVDAAREGEQNSAGFVRAAGNQC